MKILWAIAVSSFLAISCGNDHQSTAKKESTSEEVKHEHDSDAGKPGLNNGARWKADSSTNNNVRDLQDIVEKFNSSTGRSVNAYNSTGIELQSGLNKMISECKMKGADHDALHKWLEPMISEIAKLQKSATEQEADHVMKQIGEQLKLYPQYFE
jgi:hypothetical protein